MEQTERESLNGNRRHQSGSESAACEAIADRTRRTTGQPARNACAAETLLWSNRPRTFRSHQSLGQEIAGNEKTPTTDQISQQSSLGSELVGLPYAFVQLCRPERNCLDGSAGNICHGAPRSHRWPRVRDSGPFSVAPKPNYFRDQNDQPDDIAEGTLRTGLPRGPDRAPLVGDRSSG